MNETFESEMKKWEKDLKIALSKTKPLDGNTLSNQSEENKILKEFYEKKNRIYQKYNKG